MRGVAHGYVDRQLQHRPVLRAEQERVVIIEQRRVIAEPGLREIRSRAVRERAVGRPPAARGRAGEALDDPHALAEQLPLSLRGLLVRRFVQITVVCHLVAVADDLAADLGIALQAPPADEEGLLQAKLVERLHHAVDGELFVPHRTSGMRGLRAPCIPCPDARGGSSCRCRCPTRCRSRISRLRATESYFAARSPSSLLSASGSLTHSGTSSPGRSARWDPAAGCLSPSPS